MKMISLRKFTSTYTPLMVFMLMLTLNMSNRMRCSPYVSDQQVDGTTFNVQLDGSSSKLNCYPSSITQSSDLNISNIIISHRSSQIKPNWWCSHKDEYGWLGFSYDVSDCPTREEMTQTFRWMRRAKGARYVRIYSACDADNFDDDVIEAAVDSGVGIYALIWFGFDSDDKWKGRKERLLQTIKDNPKAPYVIRAVTCGSEPLFDHVLPVEDLTAQIADLKKQLNPLGILVTLSEMAAGYKANNDTPSIFKAVDFVSLHSFGFFEGDATIAIKANVTVHRDVQYGLQHSKGKKVVITQTGWPSNTNVWKANSPNAIADLDQEASYFKMLDQQCSYFKKLKIGWFSHIYNDTTLPGWGIVYENGTQKIPFNPRINC